MAKKKTEAKSEAKPETTAKKKAAPAAKKSESTSATKASSSSSSSSSSSKSSKSNKPAAAPAMPMVDTSLAAQAAAQMLGAGLGRREPQHQQTDEDKREGSLIRQLKADLNKGHAQTVSNVLDKGAPQGGKRSSGMPFGQKQVGRNQTYGADVTRSGVPRRTSG